MKLSGEGKKFTFSLGIERSLENSLRVSVLSQPCYVNHCTLRRRVPSPRGDHGLNLSEELAGLAALHPVRAFRGRICSPDAVRGGHAGQPPPRTALPPAPPPRSDHDSFSLPWLRVAPKSPPLPGRGRSGFPLKDNEGDAVGRLSHSFPPGPVVRHPSPLTDPPARAWGLKAGSGGASATLTPHTRRTRTALFNGAPGPREPESGPQRPGSVQLKARRGGRGRSGRRPWRSPPGRGDARVGSPRWR